MALIVVSCGMTSCVGGGLLADRFPTKYSKICQYGSLLAWPFFIGSVLLTNNFWLSLSFVALKLLLGDNFWSPNITLLQKNTHADKQGNMVSAYQFLNILAGCLSMVMFGCLAGTNPVQIGRNLALFGTVGYLGSAYCWK